VTCAANPRAVVLVEGNSDRVALLTLAARLGRRLSADGVEVIDMGGITNVRAFASRYGPRGLGLPLAGLYDTAQEDQLRRGLAAAGFETARLPDGPARLGFHGLPRRPRGRTPPCARPGSGRGRHRGGR
jgi:hypothetical protein